MGAIVDTHAKSGGRDIGPAIAFDSKGGIHIVTPSGMYAVSKDEGKSWKSEAIPLPPNQHIKTQSLAVGPGDVVHVAMSAVVDRPSPPSAKLGGYWQLRTVSRMPDGRWADPTNILANQPRWKELTGPDDMLADWAHIVADPRGGLHVSWHGTANSHKFANDDAFYAFKKAGGNWSAPVQLVSQEPARGIKFSYAPSLAIDGDRALAMTFYDVDAGTRSVGFDSRLVPLRDGHIDGPTIQVTQFVYAAIAAGRPDQAMGPRFPTVSPQTYKAADGHVYLDALELLQSPFEPADTSLVVYHRIDLTAPRPH